VKYPADDEMDALWAHHNAEWRDPAQVISQWDKAAETNPQLMRYVVQGNWWNILAESQITLLVTREYEHLIIGMSVVDQAPVISYMRLPHPSGLAVNRKRGLVHVASTRNPNQVFNLAPVTGLLPRLDAKNNPASGSPLTPVQSFFYPGCLYIHDLALIEGGLYANAVGKNLVVRLNSNGDYERSWWPRCIEVDNRPAFSQNYIQLNSIAAGSDIKNSYFSASADRISARRPGHRNFPVNKRGVIFSGATREPIARGLTRPHSARLYKGRIWVDNSGYGEFGFIENGGFTPIVQLPGWTRGLCFYENIAFVGISRVIPRFRQYAPGLNTDSSLCGIYAVNIDSGEILASLVWPYGNQIFAIDWISNQTTSGFPFSVGSRSSKNREKALFYAFKTNISKE